MRYKIVRNICMAIFAIIGVLFYFWLFSWDGLPHWIILKVKSEMHTFIFWAIFAVIIAVIVTVIILSSKLNMKRLFSLSWQFLIPIILYLPYRKLNETVFVKWFGCSCPRIDANGNILYHFNANDFSKIFWLTVCLILILISIISSRKIAMPNRILYLLLAIVVSIWMSFLFLSKTPMWQ